jgi:hypothetical protein
VGLGWAREGRQRGQRRELPGPGVALGTGAGCRGADPGRGSGEAGVVLGHRFPEGRRAGGMHPGCVGVEGEALEHRLDDGGIRDERDQRATAVTIRTFQDVDPKARRVSSDQVGCWDRIPRPSHLAPATLRKRNARRRGRGRTPLMRTARPAFQASKGHALSDPTSPVEKMWGLVALWS